MFCKRILDKICVFISFLLMEAHIDPFCARALLHYLQDEAKGCMSKQIK